MSKEQNPIQFQPITPGLGFHPFSDGLPYAPVSKTTPRPRAAPLDPRPSRPDFGKGTGAVAAGPASFAFPRVSVPVAKPAKTQAVPTPAPMIAAPTYGVMYLFKRMLAFTIDTAIHVGLLAAGLGLSLFNQGVNPDLLMNPGVLIVSALFFTLFSWALMTAQEIAFGTTIGKRLFGLSLHGSTFAILLRAFFFLPSIGFCGVGLLWSLVDSKKRCWHDLVVQIQPTEIARL